MNMIELTSIEEVLALQVADSWEKCTIKFAPDDDDNFLRALGSIVFYEKGKTMLWVDMGRLPKKAEATIRAFVEEKGFAFVESKMHKGWTTMLLSRIEIPPKPPAPEVINLGDYRQVKDLQLDASWDRCQLELEHSTQSVFLNMSLRFYADKHKTLVVYSGACPDEARDFIFAVLQDNSFKKDKTSMFQANIVYDFLRE